MSAISEIIEFKSDERKCANDPEKFVKGFSPADPFHLDIKFDPGLASHPIPPRKLNLVVKVRNGETGALEVDPDFGDQGNEPPIFTELSSADKINFNIYQGQVDISRVPDSDIENRYFELYKGDVQNPSNLVAKSYGDDADEIITGFTPVRRC